MGNKGTKRKAEAIPAKGSKVATPAKPATSAKPAPAASGKANGLIQEIKRVLAASGDGKVHVDNFKVRYGTLASSPKEFMESRPDIFKLKYTGSQFTVSLVGAGNQKKNVVNGATAKNFVNGPTAKKFAATSSKTGGKGNAKDALNEIAAQLKNPKNTTGKFWIPQWKLRFGHLGKSARELMESQPDRFEINEGEGNQFTVTLLK